MRSISAYTLHQASSHLLVDKSFIVVARRSTRVCTLLDLPKFDLHALGSKRVYTLRDIVDLTLKSKTPFTQYFKGTNLKFALEK
jgi:hypothetical protein